jgi:uncharacterized membrane protein YdjX (TVP38/TMEM64 family)
LAGGVALIPTYAMSALCGWSFGFPVGLTATLCGFVAAALVGFLLGRLADGGHALALMDEKPTWRAIRAALATGGFGKEVLVVALVRQRRQAKHSLESSDSPVLEVTP